MYIFEYIYVYELKYHIIQFKLRLSNFAHSCKRTIQNLSLAQLEERMCPTKVLWLLMSRNRGVHETRVSWLSSDKVQV